MAFRKQNKSCDECRRSRIGCDAHTNPGSPCSNCKRRGKTCSTNWLLKRKERTEDRKRPKLSLRESVDASHPYSQLEESPTTPGQAARREQALRLHHALWEVFTSFFEPQLGLWIGNDCNPFKRMTTASSAPKTLISRLMVTLDTAQSSMRPDPSIAEALRLPRGASRATEHGGTVEASINQALMSAVHAFSSRWLPAGFFRKTGHEDETSRKRFMQTLWDQAHQDVLQVVTLPSYRSILALYLFAITPTVTSNKMHPVSQMCYEISLRHYLQLRLESRIACPPLDPSHANHDTIEQAELGHLEDSAYWFGLVCDVSRGLLRCQPLVLLSGPSSQARVWALVSKQVEDFAIQSAATRATMDILTDVAVLRILQIGSSCKTMCWAAITDVQDALFYNRTNLDLQQALRFALSRLQQFENVFSPLLDQCARDFLLLSDKSQLGYIWLVLHYHLGVLILADTLAAGSAALGLDEQVSVANHRLASTRAVVNVINLVRQLDNFNPEKSSLLLRDPYPEHASNCLHRAAKSVLGLIQSGSITTGIAAVLASALLQGLQIVSQISFSAAESLSTLAATFREHGVPLNAKDTSQQAPTAIPLDSAVTPEMLENETLKELGHQAVADPALVVKSIERYEIDDSTPNFGLGYLQYIDFTAVAGDWDFEDCFAGG